MTVCAIEETTTALFVIAAGGAYAARLGGEGQARYVERWTLAAGEAYAVPLPLAQPEEADSGVLPLADGRVLIHRRVADRHAFALLYPTGGAGAGPRTGELPLGALDAEQDGEEVRVRLLPPAPDGHGAFALAVGASATTLWQVAGVPYGPRRMARLAGRCSGGVWLDRTGRLLSLDREVDGTAKAVVVDLVGGTVSPLLQITEDSEDRLLLADPDSGLLLIRSDAPGEPRLGWGVLGSARPVRFPECLRIEDAHPFAVQPGQALMPETCGVALRVGEAGIALWRPADRCVFRLGAPAGWLGGTGLWSAEGRLHLPYAVPGGPGGLMTLTHPVAPPAPVRAAPPAPAPEPAPEPVRPVPLQQARLG